MPDRPIIFSAPMVRALLREAEAPGTGKTQTRLPISPRNTLFDGGSWPKGRFAACNWAGAWVDPGPSPAGNPGPYLKVQWPYGGDTLVSRVYPAIQPGDRLWVREAFVTGYDIDDEFGRPVGDRRAWYRATDRGLTWYDPDSETTLDSPPWKSSIFMPRWASRLTLTVTDVRVQRLQDITEADAVAEGVNPCLCGHECPCGEHGGCCGVYEPVDAYAALWKSLHGPDAWDANDWVTALTFTVARRNIDGEPT